MTNKYDLNIFGKKIKDARKKRNLTQEQLAKIVGTSKSVISGYESGKNDPSQTMTIRLAEALRIPINWLFNSADTESLIYSDVHFKIFSNSRKLKSGAENFLGNQLNAMTEPVKRAPKEEPPEDERPSREEMLDYLSGFEIAAYDGRTSYAHYNDDQLFALYTSIMNRPTRHKNHGQD